MNTVTIQSSVIPATIENGKKTSFQRASTSHERYWQAVTNGTINGENCPKLVLFNLTELQNYLKEVAAEFERLEVPEEAQGIAVLPVMHNGEQRFNILFTPCVKDTQGACHHQFNPTNSASDDPFDWWLEGFNLGHTNP